MKIVFLCTTIYTYGGIQKVIVNMCNQLSLEHEVILLMSDLNNKKVDFGLNKSVQIYDFNIIIRKKRSMVTKCRNLLDRQLRKTRKFDNSVASKILKYFQLSKIEQKRFIHYINSNSIDILVGVEPYYSFLAGEISAEVNCKTVGWMHDTYSVYFEKKGHYCYGRTHLYQQALEKLDIILVLSEMDKALFSKKIRSNIQVLHNMTITKNNYRSTCEENNIVFVGRLGYERKGLGYLCPIMKKVCEVIPDAKLCVVGDGDDRERLERDIKDFHLEKHMTMVGEKEEVDSFFQDAKVSISTSSVEGFGVGLIEAMSVGVPVVAFANSGPMDIIQDGVSGYLIEKYDVDTFAEKIVCLLKEKELWNAMSSNAYERAKDFSAEKITKRFLEIVGS